MPDGMLDLIGAFFNLITHSADLLNLVNSFIAAKKEAEKKAEEVSKKTGFPTKVRIASVHTKEGLHIGILIDLPNDDYERAILALLRALGEEVEVLNCAKQA
ncbi:MAG: hypothetical protein ABGW50_01605 [Thermococcus sp.]